MCLPDDLHKPENRRPLETKKACKSSRCMAEHKALRAYTTQEPKQQTWGFAAYLREVCHEIQSSRNRGLPIMFRASEVPYSTSRVQGLECKFEGFQALKTMHQTLLPKLCRCVLPSKDFSSLAPLSKLLVFQLMTPRIVPYTIH